MKRTLLQIVAATIIIGVIALCINNAFGNETIMFITKTNVYYSSQVHFYIWKFDFWRYIQNLQLATSNTSVLVFNLPTRQWINATIDNWTSAFTNDFLVILDYIIVIINVILYPIKLGAYLLQNILALLGINQDTTAQNNGLAWLYLFVRNILGNFAIPYL